MKRVMCIGAVIVCGITMLYAGKEIEVKISGSHEMFEKVIACVKAYGIYKGSSKQTEYYLTKPDEAWDYSGGFKDTLRTMRVRCEAKGDSVCYKYRHLDPVTKKTTHRDEEETKVANGQAMINILGNLGYTEQTIIEKTRETYMVEDMFEVVCDDVKDIGKFIEIELKKPTDDVELGLARIQGLLKRMGVTEFKQYDRGYIHMKWNPGYEFGEERKI